MLFNSAGDFSLYESNGLSGGASYGASICLNSYYSNTVDLDAFNNGSANISWGEGIMHFLMLEFPFQAQIVI